MQTTVRVTFGEGLIGIRLRTNDDGDTIVHAVEPGSLAAAQPVPENVDVLLITNQGEPSFVAWTKRRNVTLVRWCSPRVSSHVREFRERMPVAGDLGVYRLAAVVHRVINRLPRAFLAFFGSRDAPSLATDTPDTTREHGPTHRCRKSDRCSGFIACTAPHRRSCAV